MRWTRQMMNRDNLKTIQNLVKLIRGITCWIINLNKWSFMVCATIANGSTIIVSMFSMIRMLKLIIARSDTLNMVTYLRSNQLSLFRLLSSMVLLFRVNIGQQVNLIIIARLDQVQAKKRNKQVMCIKFANVGPSNSQSSAVIDYSIYLQHLKMKGSYGFIHLLG